MGTERHYIQKQSLRVNAGSEAVAMVLQARLSDLHPTVVLETIERVLDLYSTPTQHVRIDRLSVDLGTIPFGRNFAEELSARLERELRLALDAAVREVVSHPSSARFAQSVDEARLDLLERYLTDGTLPFWTAASEFDAEAVVAEAAAATPEALVRLLRRYRDEPLVVHRLVRQLSDSGLRRLLELLDAGNAARIASEIEAALRDAGEDDARTVSPARSGGGRDDRRFSMWARVLTDTVHGRHLAFDRAAPVPGSLEGETGSGSGEAGWDAGPQGEPDLSHYDLAEALRYYLRYGVLPWTAALSKTAAGDVPPTIQTLLEALPGLPLPLLRAIFPASAGERFAAVLRAVEQMSEDTRARLLVAVSAGAPRDGLAVVSPMAADLPGSPAAYARALLRMLDGGEEGWIGTVDSSPSPGPGEARPRQWNVHWIKSVLAERARTGERAGPEESSSATLLQILMEEHPADASHFLRVLRTSGISPAALLSERVSRRLFESSLMMLPARTRAFINVLLRLVFRLPPQEQPGDEDAIRSAAMGAVLDHVIVLDQTGSGEPPLRLVGGMLRALFGPALTAVTVQHLLTEAERLARAGEWAVGDLVTLREALYALGDAASTGEHAMDGQTGLERGLAEHLERLPRAAAQRVTHLIRIVSAWPPGDRPASDETVCTAVARAVQQHGGDYPLRAAFVVVVLRAILGPHIPASAARRLVADVEGLALRGEFTSTDVEAVREAAAAMTEVDAQGPLQAEHIVAVLAERIRGQPRGVQDDSASSSLLQTLIERFPNDARAFLQKMRDDGISPSTLLGGAAAPHLVESSFELLRPLDRRLMALLLRAVSALPSAVRPGSDAMRSTIAGVALDHAGAASDGERIAAAALGALFGPTSPAPVHRRLAAEAERIARAGEFRPDAVTAFLRVLGQLDDARAEIGTKGDSEPPAVVPATGFPIAADHAAPVMNEAAVARGEAAAAPPGPPPQTSAARPAATPAEVAAALARLSRRDDAEAAAASRLDPSAAPPPDRPDITAARQSVPAHLPRLSDDALRHVLLELVDTAPDAVREALSESIADQGVRDRWVRSLSEPELARIMFLLEPTHHRVLISSAESLFSAWVTASRPRDASSARTGLWSFLLEVLSRHAEGQRSVDLLVREFFVYIGAHQLGAPAAPADRGEMAERVFGEAVSLAGRTGRAYLRAVLSENRAELMALVTAQGTPVSLDRPGTRRPAPQPTSEDSIASAGARPPTAAFDRAAPLARAPTRSQPLRQRMAFGMSEDRPEAGGDPIHIANAGLVIVGAFLPQLFARLDVLEETPTGGRRVRVDAISRTVHLLQYLVDGRTDAPEPLLCLNKVLCGVPLAVPIDREIEATARERELCESLLAAVIENWTIIRNTSIAGLRETFLQREGRLDHPPTGWRLRVQRKTLDVLLDHIPWPTSTIAHSWMPDPVFVTW